MDNKSRQESLGKLFRMIFAIAVPVMIQNITEYILVLTDTAFIGNYRMEGLAALQNVINPFFMILSFFFALSQGTTIAIAQSIGAGNKVKAYRIAEVSFFVNQFISLAYLIFWLLFGRQILMIVGARGEILALGEQYLQIIAFVFISMGLTLSAASVFQGLGKTLPIMAGSLTKTILNIAFGYCMIFGKFGFPELGIRGAGFAMIISEYAGTGVMVFWLFRLKDFRLRLRKIFKPKLSIYSQIFTIGMPAGMEYMLWSAGQVFLIFLLNQKDTLSAGFFGLLNTIINASVFVYNGVGVATINLVGKATGAGRHHEAKRAANTSLLFSFIVCIITASLFVLLPRGILSIFTSSQAALTELVPTMFIMALILFPKAVNIVGGNGIRGTGDTRWMMFTQLWGTIVIGVTAWVFLFVFKMGILGMMWAVLIDETWRAGVNYLRFMWMHRQKKEKPSSGIEPLAY